MSRYKTYTTNALEVMLLKLTAEYENLNKDAALYHKTHIMLIEFELGYRRYEKLKEADKRRAENHKKSFPET